MGVRWAWAGSRGVGGGVWRGQNWNKVGIGRKSTGGGGGGGWRGQNGGRIGVGRKGSGRGSVAGTQWG